VEHLDEKLFVIRWILLSIAFLILFLLGILSRLVKSLDPVMGGFFLVNMRRIVSVPQFLFIYHVDEFLDFLERIDSNDPL
jgi:hypothetical protein